MDAYGLAPASANTSRHTLGAKLIGLLLMLGGVVGVAVFVKVLIQAAQHGALLGILSLLGVMIFVWSGLVGFSLWLGKPGGYKWAKILFAAQIPIISIPGLQYWFYTGINSWLIVVSNASIDPVGIGLGSSLSMWLGGHSTAIRLGINPVAIIVLVFLFAFEPASRETGSRSS